MRRHPFIYEISTWVWLDELSRREGTLVTLADVPGREWDAVAQLGFDAVWLMGVWERSPAGIAIALENEDLLESFRRALPDFVTRTWSARRTASATTGSMRIWAGRTGWPRRARRSPSAGWA